MPTVVGLPQVQNYDTSGSQPLYNKNTNDLSGNLMDFIVGLGKGIKQKQDENKEADQALGQIDAINGVVREVGLLHQQNYNEGMKYGAIVQDHVKKDAQFKQNLNDLIANNPDATPEDIQELATQTAKEEVATVFASSQGINDKALLADMYKQIPKFYAQRLAEGQKALVSAAGERLQNIKGTSIADFIGYLNTESMDSPTLVNKYTTTLVSLKNAYVAAGKSQLEASNAAEQDMLAAVTTIKDIAKLNPTSQGSIAWSNNTRTLLGEILKEPNIAPEFKSKLAGIVDDITGKVLSEGDAMSSMETANYKLNKLSNPKTMDTTEDDVHAYIESRRQKFLNGEISASQLASDVNSVSSGFAEFTGRKVTMNPLPAQLAEMSYNEAHHNYGTSASEWADYKLEWFNDQNPQNRSLAAYKAIGFATAGQSYMPELVQKAGLQAYREFGGILKMTPEQFAKLGDGSKYKSDAYAQFKSIVAQSISQGSPIADDLLSQLPDDVREAVRENITTGGTLGDLQSKLSTPIDYAIKSANFDKQVSNPDYKKMELGKYWGGSSLASSGKYWGNKPSKTPQMQQAYAQALASVYKNDKSFYVSGATTDLPSNIGSNMSGKGSLISSPQGYTATPLNIPKVQAIQKAVGTGGDTSYILGHTLDLYREKYAAEHHTDAKNVIAYSTGFGANGRIAFDIYDKDGVTLLAGASIDMHSLTNQVRKNYNAFKNEIKSKEAAHNMVGFDDVKQANPVLYNKDGIFATNVQVREGYSGNSYFVNLPNNITLPYNGNAGLGRAAINHLNLWEGWHNSIQQVKGAKTFTVAQQVLVVDQNGRKTKYYDMAKNARTPQDLMNLQGIYMRDNMSNLQASARKIGIPVATPVGYPKPFEQYQMLLTDAIWLGGTGGMNKLVDSLTTSNTTTEALGKLRQTAYYKNLQPDRRKWVDNTVNNYMYIKKQGYLINR